jgi:hypothetical protein
VLKYKYKMQFNNIIWREAGWIFHQILWFYFWCAMVSIGISQSTLLGEIFILYSFGLGLMMNFWPSAKIGYGQKRAREQCKDETDSTNSSAHMSARNAERWIIAKTFDNLYSYTHRKCVRECSFYVKSAHSEKYPTLNSSILSKIMVIERRAAENQQHPIASQLTE